MTLDKKEIRIRRLSRLSEFDKLLDIQRAVWRHPDADLTPVHQFCISSKMGGILLGAYVEGGLAGFVFSFPALLSSDHCHQHSHLLAVLPQYQGLGIGKMLKWAQREWALKLGYDLITWTFDPLYAKNANLNLHTLGALTRTYWFNFYGTTTSLTHGPNIPTDRFLVEWPIKTERVRLRRQGGYEDYEPATIPMALERRAEAKDAFPKKPCLILEEKLILVEVPREIKILMKNPLLVEAWQMALRITMRHYFKRGYAAADFISGKRCFYVLRRENNIAFMNSI